MRGWHALTPQTKNKQSESKSSKVQHQYFLRMLMLCPYLPKGRWMLEKIVREINYKSLIEQSFILRFKLYDNLINLSFMTAGNRRAHYEPSDKIRKDTLPIKVNKSYPFCVSKNCRIYKVNKLYKDNKQT